MSTPLILLLMIQRTTVTATVVSGFGLSAFLFSTIAHTVFLGNTSSFLLTLALGTPTSMVLGWFLIRPCPYPEHVVRTTESDVREESNTPNSTPSETSQLIIKNSHAQLPDITGLAMMRTIDFWILFWIVSLCEYLCR